MARDWDYNEEFTSEAFYGNLGIDSAEPVTESAAEIARREDREYEARQIAAEDRDDAPRGWQSDMDDYHDVD